MRIFVGRVVDQFTLAVHNLLHKLYIGKLPVGLRGKIGGKFFRIEVQYQLDGAAVIQFNGDKNKDQNDLNYDPNRDAKMFLVTEINGNNTEEAIRRVNAYVGKEGYQKDIKKFVENLAKEIRDFNKGKVPTKKRTSAPREKREEIYFLVPVEGRNSLMWVPKSKIRSRMIEIPTKTFPGRFVAFNQAKGKGKGVFDKETGVYAVNWQFGEQDTADYIDRGMKNIEDKERFLQDHAERSIKVAREGAKLAEEPWYEKPGSAPVMKPQLETVRKEAAQERKSWSAGGYFFEVSQNYRGDDRINVKTKSKEGLIQLVTITPEEVQRKKLNFYKDSDIELFVKDYILPRGAWNKKQAKVIPIKPEKKVEMKKEKSPSVETYFIEYLNKDKGFKKDIKRFGSYDEAKNWMRRNFEKVDLDMIKIETKEKSPSVETYRQTGSSSRKHDERLDAMKPGKRRSASGGTYYEYRRNRSDKPGGKI